MKIDILMDRDADRLIGDPVFREKWNNLYHQCPWGSAFQSDDFVVTWYATYRSEFTPVIVRGVRDNGELAGLFTLAAGAKSGRLVAAGSSEAEYQAWLAEPRDGNIFIESALEKLREQFPNKALTLIFMLQTVPVEWTAPGNRWSGHCHLRTLPRGLMEIGDGSSFKDTLRKKKQSKINRLKRLGNLHLDQIQDPEELGAIFDEVIRYQTLRLRAIQNLSHVEHDPLKKAFFMNLMRLPRMIHATALRVDDKLVSAQIHNYNKDQMRLGLITHSPFYARYSPGELHILMMGVELAKEEISTFDLTPGGHYKDRYATHHDQSYILTVFFNRAHCARYKLKRRLAEAAKSALLKFKVTPEQTRDAYLTFLDWRQKWRRLTLAELLTAGVRKLKKYAWHTDEVRIYARDLNQADVLSESRPMKKDHVADLLAYQPLDASQPPVNRFMKRALERLEAGHHIYTRVEDGKLTQYGWLMEPPGQKALTADKQGMVIPADSVLLADFHAHPRGPGFSLSSLYQILSDAAGISGAKHAHLCVPAGDRALRQVAEEAGFTYQYSLFGKNRLGKLTSWSTAVQPEADTQSKINQTVGDMVSEPGD